MKKQKTRGLVLAAVVTQAALAASPLLADPSLQEITDKMNSLQTELNQLKAQQQEAVIKQHEADVKDGVIDDADTRLSLMGDGMTAGYKNRRFFIASEDGNFVLRPWIHLQIRNSINAREGVNGVGGNVPGSNDVENGFELRRARLGFDGNLVSPDFTYYINWSTYRASTTVNVLDSTTNKAAKDAAGNSMFVENNTGGLPVLEEAWLKYHITDTPFSIRAGQFHDPLSHENLVGSKYIAPERSLQGDLFENVDTFVQGVTGIYDPKTWVRAEAGVTDGIYSANTSFQDPQPNDFIIYNYGVAGRVEAKVMGNWKDYDQFTALGDQDTLLVFGAGADFSQGAGFSQFTHTVDAHFATPGGLFIYTSYLGRYITNSPGIPLGSSVSGSISGAATGRDTYEPSANFTIAYLFNQKYEPYARYEYLHLQGTPAGSNNNVEEVSLGFNWYLWGHNAKFTEQIMYLPNGIPVADTSNDILLDNSHSETVIMAQFQLLL